jgi:hypothetical protein
MNVGQANGRSTAAAGFARFCLTGHLCSRAADPVFILK